MFGRNFLLRGLEGAGTQGSYGCPIPGNVVEGEVGWGFEQSSLVEGVPAHRKVVANRGSLRSFPMQNIF